MNLKLFRGISLSIALLYVVASFFPDSQLWGMNILGFIPIPARFILIVVVSLFFIDRFSIKATNRIFMGLDFIQRNRMSVFGAFIVLVLISTMCYQLRIDTDMYGDTRTLISLLETKSYTLQDVIGFRDTEPLTRYIHQRIGSILNIEYKSVYQWTSSFAGGLYCLLMLWFVRREIEHRAIKAVFLIVGLTNGANQLFFGHVEDYTLLYITVTAYLLLAWRYFSVGRGISWILIIFVVGLKLHVEMLLFAPSLLWLLAQEYKGNDRSTPRATSTHFILGIGMLIVVGFILYAFYFKAFVLSSDEQKQMVKNIFLPLVSTPPSLNNYTLQSLEHLNDIVQVLFLTASPLAIVITIYSIFQCNAVHWIKPRILFYIAATLIPLCFILIVNPILTPQRDWDFLAIAAAPMWLFGVLLMEDLWKNKFARVNQDTFVSLSLGLGICASVIYFVNGNPEMANRRIRALGVAAFKGYHLGSAYLVNVGCKNIANIDDEIMERNRILEDLRSAKIQNDHELAFLYYKSGEAYYRNEDYLKARRRFIESVNEYPSNTDAMKGLAVVSLKSGAIDQAIRFLDLFNHRFNEPEVHEPKALWMAEVAHYVSFLKETGADSNLITRELAQIKLVN